MKLSMAVLCLDCEEVYELGGLGLCPLCGGAAFCLVSSWIDRTLVVGVANVGKRVRAREV